MFTTLYAWVRIIGFWVIYLAACGAAILGHLNVSANLSTAWNVVLGIVITYGVLFGFAIVSLVVRFILDKAISDRENLPNIHHLRKSMS